MFAPIRLRDLGIFHTVIRFDKTEMSLYLDDLPLLGRNKCPRHNSDNFIPNSYPPNSLISEKIEIRELFTACQPVPATVKGASFQKFKHLNLAASFSNDDVSSKPSSFIIMTRYYRGCAFNS
jgi:hypothetical protein